MVAVYHILNRATFFAGTDSDRNAMLIAAAHKEHFFAQQALIAYVNIGWHIHACQVANMNRTVGIGERSSHKCAFKFLLLHINYDAFLIDISW